MAASTSPAALPFANAIAWAQFRLLGGWRNMLTTVGAYAAILAVAMFAFVRGLESPPSVTYSGFRMLFAALQVLALLMFGMLRVGSAVRTDVSGRVIESHRLMPMSPAAAVVGYIIGPAIQAMGLFVVNFVLGGIAAAGAGLPLQTWMLANAVMLAFAVFLWVIVVFFSFRSAVVVSGIVIAVVGAGLTQGMALYMVPGLNVLITPMIGHTVFDPRSQIGIDWVYPVAIAFQAGIGALYFLAACRRYRSEDAIGFVPILGLLLVVLWAATSVMGMLYWNDFRAFGRYGFYGDDSAMAQFMTTLSITMLLGVLPVASSARLADAPPPGTPARRKLTLPPGAVALASAGAVMILLMAAPPLQHHRAAAVRTFIVVAAFLVTMRYVLGIAYQRRMRSRRLAFGWIAITWAVPIVIELIRQSLEDPRAHHVGAILLLSPLGELVENWAQGTARPHTNLLPGLIFPCALAGVMASIYYAGRARRRAAATNVQAQQSGIG